MPGRETSRGYLLYLALGVFLCLASRLPFLVGGSLAPDSDECILGLMATHVAQGEALPILFYGQDYGFALLETAVGALFFKLFGTSIAVLKFAMLLLWIVGWWLLVLAVRRFSGIRAALFLGILLAACPAWALWSMKARGGYLTAFLFTNLSLWLLSRVHAARSTKAGTFAGIGACVGLVYWSQPLWLPGLLLFLICSMVRRKRALEAVALAASAISIAGLLYIATRSNHSEYWSPKVIDPEILQALYLTPRRLWVHLSASYYYTLRITPGTLTVVSATLWLAVIVVACILPFVAPRRTGCRSWPARVGAWSALAGVVSSLLISNSLFSHRYLLPLSGFALPVLAIGLAALWRGKRRGRPFVLATTAILTIAGVGSFLELRDVSSVAITPAGRVRWAGALELLVEELLDADIHHVYVPDATLQWPLMFLSQEAITARSYSPTGRLPQYARSVDTARRQGRRVAVVGDVADMDALNSALRTAGLGKFQALPIAHQFYILLNPTVEILERMRFEFSR